MIIHTNKLLQTAQVDIIWFLLLSSNYWTYPEIAKFRNFRAADFFMNKLVYSPIQHEAIFKNL